MLGINKFRKKLVWVKIDLSILCSWVDQYYTQMEVYSWVFTKLKGKTVWRKSYLIIYFRLRFGVVKPINS